MSSFVNATEILVAVTLRLVVPTAIAMAIGSALAEVARSSGFFPSV